MSTKEKSDFEAFLARLHSPESARYEKRSEPDLADAIDGIAAGLETFKEKQGSELRELKGQLELLETRLSRPGVSQDRSGSLTPTTELRWQVNGREARVLRSLDEVRSYFDSRSRDAMDAENGGAQHVRMSDFLRGVANLNSNVEVRAALSVGTDADGGYLVPIGLMSNVLQAMVPESTVLNAGALMLPLDMEGAGAKSFTIAGVDSLPTASWRAENGNVVESEPGFRAVTMTMRSLSFYFKTSREWLADAFGTDQILTTVIAQAFAKELDRASLRGSGTAPEPRGIRSTSGIVAVGNGADGATLASTKYANFFSAAQQILEANSPMPNAAIMSPRSRVALASLVDTTGQPLAVPEMLRGLQMGVTSQIPNNLTVGESDDCSEIYLGNFPHMVIGMRERMSIQRVNELFATTGQVGFVCHLRADVALLYPKSFAVVSGVR
jgi:HK97 family phage major capsid protein